MIFQIGAISFLNTVPLIEWFETEEGRGHALLRVLPSQLTGILRRGEAHVGLLPVAEVLRGHTDGILAGTGIACRGEADSVKVFCAESLAELTRIRADRGSRSSVALLRILLKEMFGISPAITEMIPDAGMVPAAGEGLLIIGDRCFEYERALSRPGREGVRGWDLGKLWLDLTGLPFVFAAWALAPGFLAEYGRPRAAELKGVLNRARDYGLSRIGSLAQRAAAEGQLGVGGEANPAAVKAYLEKSLRYRLGAEDLAGMKRFQELGRAHGLFPELPFPAVI